MRRLNGLLAFAAVILFIVHGIMGALLMTDIYPVIVKPLSYAVLATVGLHAVISTGYTIRALHIARKTHASYFRENRLFWARRISGFVIMALMFFHVTAFTDKSGGVFRLVPFDAFRLITQLLFLFSVTIHVISNIKPSLMTFGVRRIKSKTGTILFFISSALFIMAAAFIVYYIRWQMNAV